MKQICALMVLVSLSIVSAAQITGSSDFHELKVYGGYQYTQLDTHAAQDQLNLQHALDPTFPLLNFGNHKNLSGWNLGVEEDTYAKWFGLVVDIGGGYGTNKLNLGTTGSVSVQARTRMRMYTATIGPQFTLRMSGRVQPFIRVLIGGAWERISANVLENNVPQFAEVKARDEGFAYGGGGGIDFFFSKRVGLRLSADGIRTPFFNDTQNNLRGAGGLVFRF
ncbi:MAG: hypothetical protein JWN74_2879 [Acidobacteriaceae bacterium]|nr:hypothetical protein [Acidobacteriaceae bacterium]